MATSTQEEFRKKGESMGPLEKKYADRKADALLVLINSERDIRIENPERIRALLVNAIGEIVDEMAIHFSHGR